MKKTEDSILGCFFKVGFDPDLTEEDFMNMANIFRVYIWGEDGKGGINRTLKKLCRKDYGNDIELILFEFHVNPTMEEMHYIKEVGSYRKKEKAIGLPIIVNNDNFFSQSEEERIRFLKKSVLEKIKLLKNVIKTKKLDTDLEKLYNDLALKLEG